jgi:hypothetical protein
MRLSGSTFERQASKRVLTCVSTIKHSILKLRGRERRLISKASATGMSPLSPQGWVHGDFAFNLLSLTCHQFKKTTYRIKLDAKKKSERKFRLFFEYGGERGGSRGTSLCLALRAAELCKTAILPFCRTLSRLLTPLS